VNNILARSLNQPTPVEPQATDWSERAQQMLLSAFPDLLGDETVVEMVEQDEQNQTGIGSILLRRGQAMVQVPFFVRDGHLQPLDLMLFNDELMPLTQKRLQRLFFAQSEPGTLARSGSDGHPIYGNTPVNEINAGRQQPPYGVKTAALLLEEVVTAQAEGRLAAKVAALPDATLLALAEQGATQRLVPPAAPAEPHRAFHVEAVGPGQYKFAILGRVDGPHFPHLHDAYQLAGGAAQAFMEKVGWSEGLQLVDRQGYATFPVEATVPLLDEALSEDVTTEKLAATGLVWDTAGRAHEGVAMQLHTFDGTPTDAQFFLSPTGHAQAPQIEGQAKQADVGALIGAMRLTPWSFAQKVAYVWQDDAAGWHITEPLRIKSKVASPEGDTVRLTCITPLGHPVQYKTSSLHAMLNKRPAPEAFKGADGLGLGSGPSEVAVPRHFVPIALDTDPIALVGGDTVKAAFAQRRGTPHGSPLRIEGGHGTWRASHAHMDKVASLDDYTLPIFLACVGVMPRDQYRVQDKLAADGSARLWQTDLDAAPAPPPRAATKVARRRTVEHQKVAECLAAHAPVWLTLATDIAKVANPIDGEVANQMTDTGMSLALAEEDQVDAVAQALPQIEEVIAACAQLLIQARKGELPIVPDIIRKAMQALDLLAEHLASLQDSGDEIAQPTN